MLVIMPPKTALGRRCLNRRCCAQAALDAVQARSRGSGEPGAGAAAAAASADARRYHARMVELEAQVASPCLQCCWQLWQAAQ